ncbi:DUF3987 domain-containing protein [Vineibacter terrae]|uniref:DUF3987 domain-containing protein n=1 Tax=Vineibacter terrae TaxID=2586908 RepID=UPI002E32D3D1|nr:DUF3987 domain-containing protein [Vineibacter terrae]HEX2890784.1 DUF3987 domain-containing protein [Vineibacter terrae]
MSARDFEALTHSHYGKPLRWWRYGDDFAVASVVARTGRLLALPAVRNGAHCYWGEPALPLPLYRAATLELRPQAPVLVVQGESAADAAAGLFTDHVCVTWAGGGNGVAKADVMPLHGRDVILWPDNDGAGVTAMARLAARLRGVARTVAPVAVPQSWPASWNIARPLPAGITAETLRAMLPGMELHGGTSLRREDHDCHPERSEGSPANGAPCVSRRRSLAALGMTMKMCDHPAPTGEAPLTQPAQPESPAVPPSAPAGAWPAPDLSLLDDRQGDVPAFPVALLPGFWATWCENAARGGVPVDHVAMALLSAAAGLIGAARCVGPVPGWTEPCLLWTVLVGPSASGKTAGMDAALHLVRALDRELEPANADLLGRHTVAQEEARWAAFWWRKMMRRAVITNRERPPMPAAVLDTPVFAPRRLVIEDASVDTVAGALRGNPRGLLLAPDGLAAWLDTVAGAGKADPARAWWLKAWSAGGGPVRRAGDQACGAVSVLGAIEPDALGAALAGDDDSVGARLLFAQPGRGPVAALGEGAAALAAPAQAALRRLRDMPDTPRTLALSAGAQAAFEDFRQVLDIDGLEDAEAAWCSRGPSLVLRLAGIWTFLDWAAQATGNEPRAVGAPALTAASDLWLRYLWPHARSVLGTIGAGGRRRRMRKVLLWIRRRGLAEIGREDVWRHARAARNAPDADLLLDGLVAAGWLRPVDATRAPTGRRRLRWLVNPALGNGVVRDA